MTKTKRKLETTNNVWNVIEGQNKNKTISHAAVRGERVFATGRCVNKI